MPKESRRFFAKERQLIHKSINNASGSRNNLSCTHTLPIGTRTEAVSTSNNLSSEVESFEDETEFNISSSRLKRWAIENQISDSSLQSLWTILKSKESVEVDTSASIQSEMEQMSNSWIIVQFLEEEGTPVKVAPCVWLSKTKPNFILWPSIQFNELANLIEQRVLPGEDWTESAIRTIGAPYDDYTVAQSHAKCAQETSQLPRIDVKIEERRYSSTSDENTDPIMDIQVPDFQNVEEEKYVPDNSEEPASSTFNIEARLNQIQDSLNCGLNIIFKKIDQLAAKQDSNDKLLQSFLNKEMPIVEYNWLNDEFPIDSDDKLKHIEAQLEVQVKELELIKCLRNLGGRNTKHFIKRSMDKLLTYNYGEEFSWMGLKGKKVFKPLKLIRILKLSATIFADSSEQLVEERIKEWLRRAPERAVAEKIPNT